ncbi:hypothetical protein BDV96DRAFT_604475 [Lophiotrema nucula]|uniref:Uncharacterized protein n=1 Tax=Lophiotrema nucula TaxID=690887 RepID=A0A6A5YS70_9PLEO|nr:hypothetical protein BDV96DRAFT_604475 [Lophiotrema nucula]
MFALFIGMRGREYLARAPARRPMPQQVRQLESLVSASRAQSSSERSTRVPPRIYDTRPRNINICITRKSREREYSGLQYQSTSGVAESLKANPSTGGLGVTPTNL